MALTPIQQVNLLIGNVPANPLYPIYTDEEIQEFLDLNNQDVYKAARMAAISAAFIITSYNTREITGDIQVYNEYASRYLDALKYFIENPDTIIPSGLFPWSANTSPCNKLMDIEICDGDNCKDVCGCSASGCACNCVAGPTF